jgi:hypothetical protein
MACRLVRCLPIRKGKRKPRRLVAYQSHLDDPEYWLDRAEQVRALVDQVSNQKAKDEILRIVADYDLLAFRAQERAKR